MLFRGLSNSIELDVEGTSFLIVLNPEKIISITIQTGLCYQYAIQIEAYLQNKRMRAYYPVNC